MPAERQLVLQELTLLPSAEWSIRLEGWLVLRLAEGAGYWLNSDSPNELAVGDVLVAPANTTGVLRASRIGPLKIQYYLVQPPLLNGILAMADGRQLDALSAKAVRQPLIWPAAESLAERFALIVTHPPHEGLSSRCRLLQLWADAVGQLFETWSPSAECLNLRDRFQKSLQEMSPADLATCSLGELAERLRCSPRHLSRLFRDEMGVPFRARQTELRLMRAREILAESDMKIIHVAYGSGYRNLGLFNAMFKKRFGMTPREWRRQNAPKNSPARARSVLAVPSSAVTSAKWRGMG